MTYLNEGDYLVSQLCIYELRMKGSSRFYAYSQVFGDETKQKQQCRQWNPQQRFYKYSY